MESVSGEGKGVSQESGLTVATQPTFSEACENRKLREQLHALADAIRRREVSLFVGGGISQNLGLPNFSELVQHLACEGQLDTDELNPPCVLCCTW